MGIYLDSAGENFVVFSFWKEKNDTLTFPSAFKYLRKKVDRWYRENQKAAKIKATPDTDPFLI